MRPFAAVAAAPVWDGALAGPLLHRVAEEAEAVWWGL
eukprot:gene12797-7959_t